jgi:hypothetical protein
MHATDHLISERHPLPAYGEHPLPEPTMNRINL